MSQVIWKFPVFPDVFVLDMPKDAILLSVGTQLGTLDAMAQRAWGTDAHPRFWALVDPNAPKVKRRLACVGTGNPLPAEMDEGFVFVGTVQMHDGRLVVHLFDGGEA